MRNIITPYNGVVGVPNLEKLEWIGGNREDVMPLINQSGLKKLKYLKLQDCRIQGRDMEALSNVGMLGTVERLNLENNQVGFQRGFIEQMREAPLPDYNQGFARFFGVPAHPLTENVAGLRAIDLSGNHLGGETWCLAILNGNWVPAPLLSQLHEFNASHNVWREDQLRALKGNDAIGKITYTDFSGAEHADRRILGLERDGR